MTPLTNGYYLSDLIQHEERHAGVRMTNAYYRFLQFFPDGFWLWSDRNRWDFDFTSFVSSLNLAEMRLNPRSVSPASSLECDGGHVFEFGTFRMNGSEIVLSLFSPTEQMTFDSRAHVVDSGRELRTGNQRFLWRPFAASAQEPNSKPNTRLRP